MPSWDVDVYVCVVLFIVCRRRRCCCRHTRSLPHAPINPANMCINLYSMEAVLFQLLSIKNAFDFAFTSTFKIEIKIEIECFLIGICKFSLFVAFCHFTLSVTLAFPVISLPTTSGSLALYRSTIAITDYFRCAFLSLALHIYLSPLGNIKWKTQPVNFVYNLSYAIISQNYLFVTSCRYIIIFHIWNRFYDCTVMKQCNKLKLQHNVVWEHTMHTHTYAHPTQWQTGARSQRLQTESSGLQFGCLKLMCVQCAYSLHTVSLPRPLPPSSPHIHLCCVCCVLCMRLCVHACMCAPIGRLWI